LIEAFQPDHAAAEIQPLPGEPQELGLAEPGLQNAIAKGEHIPGRLRGHVGRLRQTGYRPGAEFVCEHHECIPLWISVHHAAAS
jgi:hypothetical protein